MLRTQAEMQNVRRRADADVEKAHKFGVEKFANEMISVVDNLERAIAACDAQDAATKSLARRCRNDTHRYVGFISENLKWKW